jgi:hypothetical protein
MKKYLVLYRVTASALEQLAKATPEQSKAMMDAWYAWAKKAGPAVVDLGCPTTSPQKYSSSKGAPQAGDASVGGFSILQAETKDKLEEVLTGHPHFASPGAAIEVHEVVPIM